MEDKIVAVREIQKYIENRINEPITLAELSKVANYSLWHTSRIFKGVQGADPAMSIGVGEQDVRFRPVPPLEAHAARLVRARGQADFRPHRGGVPGLDQITRRHRRKIFRRHGDGNNPVGGRTGGRDYAVSQPQDRPSSPAVLLTVARQAAAASASDRLMAMRTT